MIFSFRRATHLLLLSISMLLLSACTSSKNQPKEQVVMSILLKEDLSERYLKSNYANFNIAEVKRSNKTLNQYRAKFSCTTKQLNDLKKRLKDDSNVQEWTVNKDKGVEIQSGTNQKSSKVGPIKNQ